MQNGQVADCSDGDFLADHRDTPGPAWSAALAWIGTALDDIGLAAASARPRVTEVAQDRMDAALVGR